jgi:hypothetical protein
MKKNYLIALGLFLAIPVVGMLGPRLTTLINPEIAAHYPHYERNFRLLTLAQHVIMLATLLTVIGLWILTCFFILRSKGRSYGWLLLAALGPFGFVALCLLKDSAPTPQDSQPRFVGRLNIFVRILCELLAISVSFELASLIVDGLRELIIRYQAAQQGVSVAEIVQIQDASGGMWAFSEGLEFIFLFVLLYLLWTIGFNMIGRWRQPKLSGT